MGLRSFESKSLAMMLKGRVRYLYFEPNSACDYSLLENYDGLGSCESMKLICCKFKMKEILNPWAKSVGWTVAEHGRGFLMQQKDVDAVHGIILISLRHQKCLKNCECHKHLSSIREFQWC